MDALSGLFRLAANSVNFVFTDPPYNIGVDYGYGNRDRMAADAYDAWCAQWFTQVARVLVPGGSAYFMHYPEVCAGWKAMLDPHLTFRRWLTWAYATNVGHGRANWTRSQRTILFYTKGDDYVFNPLADAQPYKNPGDKQVVSRGQPGTTPYDMWNYNLVKNVSREKTRWPNQIPVAPVSRAVLTFSSPGNLVLDPFMGSGTTACAAALHGRRWLGSDSNPDSQTVCGERLAALSVVGEKIPA